MAEKKRILYIVEAMGGGVFTYIVDLANELIKKYDICIAYSTRPQTPKNYVEYFDKRIRLIKVQNFCRSINLIKDVKAFIEIRKIAMYVKPDVIHFHSSKAGAIGRWAFDGKNIPLFYTPHGYSFLMQNYSTVKRMIYKATEIICGRRNCTTISCSEGEYQETFKVARHSVYVNNGVNINKLQKMIDAMNKIEECSFTVFTLGRICYQKNPRLFNKIASAMPNVKFMWIGDGELRDELSAPNIEIIGWVERKEALHYSMQGDVFLLTSLWEGLPISLLEAMYMKKVCIVSDVIGNRNVIKNSVNGFICHDINEYIDAIRFAKNKDTSQMRNSAFQDIMCTYNTSIMAEELSGIYTNRINMICKRG